MPKSIVYRRNGHPVNMDSTIVSGRIILSGASGMLGGALLGTLTRRKIPALQLLRRKATDEGQLQWNPGADRIIENSAPLEGAEAAIHLSGANVAAHRWTDAYRRELGASRVESTHKLATLLATLEAPPKTFVVASAIGIYGDRGDEVLTESVAARLGFSCRSLPAMGSCGGASGAGWDTRLTHAIRRCSGARARRTAADVATLSRRPGCAAGQRTAMDELGKFGGRDRRDLVCAGAINTGRRRKCGCAKPRDECRVHTGARTATAQTRIFIRARLRGTDALRTDGG